jgi:hypothetical protein
MELTPQFISSTHKLYDLFLSQPPLIHVVTHCIIMSNSQHNSCHLFTSITFITSMIPHTSVHITPLLY